LSYCEVVGKTRTQTEGNFLGCVSEHISLNWYAVYVKSRHEFVTAEELTRKGVAVFSPTIKKVSRWTDRKKLIECPLFAGYIFVRISGEPGAFLEVLKTRGVVTFVSLEPGLPTPIDAAEITSLRLIIESGRVIDVYPSMQEGMQVRLRSGPLMGASGVLRKKESEFVFSVNLELLGRSVAVRVSPNDIETV
jgi:transcription termination/antitermination protein NusG